MKMVETLKVTHMGQYVTAILAANMTSHILAIRADASADIGTGHVMRMLALAQAWCERFPNGHVVFVCASLPETLETRLLQEKYSLFRLDAASGGPDDLKQTRDVLCGLHGDPCRREKPSLTDSRIWVVTDGYAFGLEFQKGIRGSGYKLLVVDDYNHLPQYECDILLNQNIGAESYPYHVNEDAKRLLGPRHALLRREFLKAGPTKLSIDVCDEKKHKLCDQLEHHSNKQLDVSERATNLLVTMGGADKHNVTLKVLEALQNVNVSQLNVKVLVGPANCNIESLKKLVASTTRHRIELIYQTHEMPTLLKWADVAVSAGGSTCWELCYFGVPMILLVLAENQQRIVSLLVQAEAARCGEDAILYDHGKLSLEIANVIRNPKLRNELSAKARCLVDSFGARRVVEAMNPSAPEHLVIRAGQNTDIALYFQWVNDPIVRSSALRSNVISFTEHQAWFSERLADSRTILYVMEVKGLPIGQVRFEIDSSGIAWLDYSLDAIARGRGWGRYLVGLGIKEFIKGRSHSVCAKVKKENQASIAVLESIGLEKTMDGDIVHFRLRANCKTI